MKPKIYHVVNPYKVAENTEESTVQNKTIQSMVLAREYAQEYVDITFVLKVDSEELDFFKAQFTEDFFVFDCIEKTSLNLNVDFNVSRRLPLLSEIIKVTEYSPLPGAHLVFTNMDICLQPFFYCEIVKMLNTGFDCFVINRRTVPKELLMQPLENAFVSDGDKHIGHDCFVVPTEIIQKFNIQEHILGIGFVFRPFLLNCILHSENFHEFDDVYMTFHYGDDMEWKSDKYSDYLEHNKALMIKVYTESKALIENADDKKQMWIKSFFPFDFLPTMRFKDV